MLTAMLGKYLAGVGATQAQNGAGALLAPLGTALERVGHTLIPTLLPGVDEIMRIYLRGDIDQNVARIYLRYLGCELPLDFEDHIHKYQYFNGRLRIDNIDIPQNKGIHLNTLRGLSYSPDFTTLLEMRNRNIISANEYWHFMKQLGCGDWELARSLLQLRHQIPGPSDLIRFAVREAFDTNVITEYGYHKELPKAILPYMEQQGFGGQLDEQRPAGATYDDGAAAIGPQKWFDKFWYSHWELPSITEGQNMMFRLYMNSDYGPSPDWIPGTTFNEDDLAKLLKTNDIPEYWRKRITQISYSPLTRVDVRRMHKLGVMNDAAVYHAYRAIGYNDTNAKHLLNFTIESNKPKIAKPKANITKDKICKMLGLGIVGREKASELLTRLGYRLTDIVDFLDHCELDFKLKLTEKIIESYHKAVLTGTITANDAYTKLILEGVHDYRALQMIELWTVERDNLRKTVSAKEALTLFKNGLITRQEVEFRLSNLNYRERDIQVLLLRALQETTLAYQKQALAQAKMLAKQAKARAKARAKKLSNVLRHDLKIIDQALDFNKPNVIKVFFDAGIVTTEELIKRLMLAKHWTKEDAELWVKANILTKKRGKNGKAKEDQTSDIGTTDKQGIQGNMPGNPLSNRPVNLRPGSEVTHGPQTVTHENTEVNSPTGQIP